MSGDVDWVQVDEALAELSDVEYQRRVWLHPTPELVGSLTEAWEQLFDDSGLRWTLDREPATLDDSFVSLVRRLHRHLQQVDPSGAAGEMIESEAMAQVRSAARRTRDALRSAMGGP
jgi:hypothetical protein